MNGSVLTGDKRAVVNRLFVRIGSVKRDYLKKTRRHGNGRKRAFNAASKSKRFTDFF